MEIKFLKKENKVKKIDKINPMIIQINYITHNCYYIICVSKTNFAQDSNLTTLFLATRGRP